MPAEARQTVPAVARALVGHCAEAPLHCSARSQAPVDARQTTVDVAKLSVGQAAEFPVQVSGRSQAPAEARQVMVAGWYASGGQAPALQKSGASQGPAGDRQIVEFGNGGHAPSPLQTPVLHEVTAPSHSLSGSVALLTGAHVPFAWTDYLAT